MGELKLHNAVAKRRVTRALRLDEEFYQNFMFTAREQYFTCPASGSTDLERHLTIKDGNNVLARIIGYENRFARVAKFTAYSDDSETFVTFNYPFKDQWLIFDDLAGVILLTNEEMEKGYNLEG